MTKLFFYYHTYEWDKKRVMYDNVYLKCKCYAHMDAELSTLITNGIHVFFYKTNIVDQLVHYALLLSYK